MGMLTVPVDPVIIRGGGRSRYFFQRSCGKMLNFGALQSAPFSMTLVERFRRIQTTKFAFGKNTVFAKDFARACGAFSMHDTGYGLGLPNYLSAGDRLRAVFFNINQLDGVFLFNISGVNLKRAERVIWPFQDAYNNSEITEWELFMIRSNKDYLKRCIFHNGKVAFKKRILWKSIQL